MAAGIRAGLKPEFLLDLLNLSQTIVVDLDDRIVVWTKGCEHLYGWRADEAVGQRSSDLLGAQHPLPWPEFVARLRQRGAWEGEVIHKHRDGHTIAIATVWRMRPETDAAAAAIVQNNTDITEVKRREEATFENAAVGITHIDAQGCWLRVNRKLCQTLGYNERELIGHHFSEITHPQDVKEDLWQYGRLMRGEIENYVVEKRYVAKDGGIVWVRVMRTAQRGTLDRPTYSLSVSIIEELAQRKEAERALLASRQRLTGIIESAMDAIISIDENHRIALFNSAAERLFGCSATAAIGAPINRFIPERFRPAHEQHIHRFAESGQTRRTMGKLGIVTGLRATGEEFPIEASVSQVDSEDGKLFTVILRDVTERLKTEQAMGAAMEFAERANKAKDQFMAVLSHELRTPLTPVLAMASLLESDEHLSEELRQNMQVIRRNAELEARLIDDLLDVTRITRGKVELKKRTVPICTILQRAVEVCQPDLEARQLDFVLDIRQPPHFVSADGGRMQQVFWNLLRNSIKFTPPGGRVGITCWSDGKQVTVEVKDSGIGIGSEHLDHIFDPFDQGSVDTSRQFGGLGLGLTICRGLVEAHGGSIQAYSDGTNKGSTFTVRLPKATDLPNAMADAVPQYPTAAGKRSLKILLVEDHGDTARIVCRLLEMNGHEVETAADVATGLRLAREGSFELLISDLGLPDGSGLDLIRALRAAGSKLPAIALSGYGQKEDAIKSQEAGFAAHLTKPISLLQLDETIAEITQQMLNN